MGKAAPPSSALLAGAALVSGASLPARADDLPPSPPVLLRVDGRTVSSNGSEPVEVQGQVLVPLRGVLERIGATVAWDEAAKTATIKRAGHRLSLTLGSATAEADGRDLPLKVPAQAVRGKIMVPLEPVGEALGATVRWDARARTMEVSTATPAPERAAPAPAPVAAKSLVPAKSAVAVRPVVKKPVPAKAAPAKPAPVKAAPRPFLQDYKDPKKAQDDLPMGKVLLDLVLKLIVVLGIAWVAIFILSKFKGTGGPLPGRKGHMKVLESVNLGPNRSVHLVRVGEKVLVVGSTPEQVNTLGEVEDPTLRDELMQDRSPFSFNAHLNEAMQREDAPDGLAGNVQGGARHIWDRVQEIRGLGGDRSLTK